MKANVKAKIFFDVCRLFFDFACFYLFRFCSRFLLVWIALSHMTCRVSLLPWRTSLHGLEGGAKAPAVPADVALEAHVHVVPGAAELLRLRLGVTQLSQPRGIRIWASVNLGESRNKDLISRSEESLCGLVISINLILRKIIFFTSSCVRFWAKSWL